MPMPPPVVEPVGACANLEESFSGELVKEFQKAKLKLQEAMVLREQKRDEMMRQLHIEKWVQLTIKGLEDTVLTRPKRLRDVIPCRPVYFLLRGRWRMDYILG